MSSSSPRLDLPYMEAAQAQKHVTHNEALRGLDLLVQLTVEGFEQTSPPALPWIGQVFALGDAPTGDWLGQAHMLALYEQNGWRFTQPSLGWLASEAGGDVVRIWTGTGWEPVSANSENLPGVGVNTHSDPVNRLAVSASATLLSHEGSDHRLIINKASDGDTASVLFQNGWMGHAEIGLAGDTGFSVKVSPDGSSWHEAMHLTSDGQQLRGDVVISDLYDTTPGKLLLNGSHGVGALALSDLDPDAPDLATGFFRGISGLQNNPNNENWHILHMSGTPNAQSAQLGICDCSAAMPSKLAIRHRDNMGEWSGWNEIYGRSNILGPVSQLNGEPAGHVMERGRNSNGEYIRFADGTQICWKQLLGLGPINNLSGSMYFDGGQSIGTLPSAFVGTPCINISANGNGTLGTWVSQSASAYFFLARATLSAATDFVANIVAVGRWF